MNPAAPVTDTHASAAPTATRDDASESASTTAGTAATKLTVAASANTVTAASSSPGTARETWRGELELGITARPGRSVATHQFHRGALRVLRPHYLDASGQVTYTVVNPGGAYLDGDRYRVAVTVGDGADLLLTTQSATKVYRTPVGLSTQEMTVCLGSGARLEYLPDQLIAYRDSRYRQHTLVDMDPSATLVLAEVVTPGWSPTGEPFRYDSVRLRTEVRMSGRPVALDNIRLEPSGDEPGFDGVGSFERFSHVGSLLVLDPRVNDAALAAVRALLTERAGHLRGGASALAVPGFALRVLGNSTQEIDELILAAVAVVRERFFGQGPVNLRKY